MPWIATTLAEVAEFFGRKYDTIRKDWREAGMPGEDGNYDLSAIAQWKMARFQEALADSGGEHDDLEAEKLREEIRFKKLKNDHTEGLLIRIDQVVQEASQLTTRVRDRLQALPDEIEMDLPADVRREVKRRIEDKINLTLKEMSQWQIETQ